MRKLARVQENRNWLNAAFGLAALIKRAKELYDAGSITHEQALNILDTMQAKKMIAGGSETKQ